MRGLLFTGGGRPDMALASRFFGDWDAVYAADSGLGGVYEAGLRADFVIGDMDSLEDDTLLSSFSPEQIIRSPRDKDLTDTELAMDRMRKNGITEIVLIGGDGGRMDHFFALERLFSRDNPPVMWIGATTLCLMLEGGSARNAVSVQGLAGQDVSVFPVAGGRCRMHAEGLIWPIDGLDWENGAYSLSNRTENGSCTLRAEEGRFLVVLPLEGTCELL